MRFPNTNKRIIEQNTDSERKYSTLKDTGIDSHHQEELVAAGAVVAVAGAIVAVVSVVAVAGCARSETDADLDTAADPERESPLKKEGRDDKMLPITPDAPPVWFCSSSSALAAPSVIVGPATAVGVSSGCSRG